MVIVRKSNLEKLFNCLTTNPKENRSTKNIIEVYNKFNPKSITTLLIEILKHKLQVDNFRELG